MTFEHAMNIHVLDKNSVPVAGALVTILVSGSAKAKGKSRGFINAPLKLRFNTQATSVRLTVEYDGKLMADQPFLTTDRDATIQLKEVEMPPPPGRNTAFTFENWSAFIFGSAMLLLLFFSPMILPDKVPDYLSKFYSKIPLTLLSLGAAGFAAALTGFILVQIGKEDKNYVIRAGGALAVFVIVFFWNPASP